jgi:hypothetical protein
VDSRETFTTTIQQTYNNTPGTARKDNEVMTHTCLPHSLIHVQIPMIINSFNFHKSSNSRLHAEKKVTSGNKIARELKLSMRFANTELPTAVIITLHCQCLYLSSTKRVELNAANFAVLCMCRGLSFGFENQHILRHRALSLLRDFRSKVDVSSD